MSNPFRRIAGWTPSLAVFVGIALSTGMAFAEDHLKSVHFARGQSSTTIQTHLVRGDSDIYNLAAKAGQIADIRITSLEDNASLSIYRPPSSLKRDDDGWVVDGPWLEGADPLPEHDAGATHHFHGRLPASGNYYVVVSSDRGNVSYDLKISVR